MLRRITARVGVILLASAAALALVVAPVHSTPAHANPTSGFKPGNIVADSLFYNGNAMSASQTQSFLNKRMPTHTSQSLRNYKQRTTSKSSSAYCAAYAGKSSETAAQIIHKVGKACGISQKAIVVMLEKETSLVGMRSPQNWRYDRAMGYACPDTGPGGTANCDTSYYGFFNQVWNGARQLKRYGMDSGFNWFPVGKTSNIQYHPNKSCGTKSVRIVNKATAALHYYTPYTPNQAALNAGWGTGNSCSSYGNRNFYSFYKSWFGNPLQSVHVTGDIAKYWKARGSEASVYGHPTAARNFYGTRFDEGLWLQHFVGGIITTEMNTGKTVGLPYGRAYEHYNDQAGGIRGALGGPVSEPANYAVSGGGKLQWFQGGFIVSSSAAGSTASMPYGPVYEIYNGTLGGIYGEMGYPTSLFQKYNGGQLQNFQNGIIAQADGSKAPVYMGPGPIYSYFNTAAGGIYGKLGFPASNVETHSNGVEQQHFTRGILVQLTNGSLVELSGADFNSYQAAEEAGRPLGIATGVKRSYSIDDGAKLIPFERGVVVEDVRSGGTSAVSGDIYNLYNGHLGGIYGSYGLPVAEERAYAANGGGTLQNFRGGLIVTSGTHGTAAAMQYDSPVFEKYNDQEGGIHGWLGYPIANEVTRADGWRSQQFQHGVISVASDGQTVVLPTKSDGLYRIVGTSELLGKQTGASLKYSANGGAWISFFERGMITEEAKTGVAVMLRYDSPIYRYYNEQAGGIYGDLGYPIGEETTDGDVTTQRFQEGTLRFQNGKVSVE